MGEMVVNIVNTTMVKPSQETPRRRMYMSNVDLALLREYVPNIYFYKFNGSPNFFNPKQVKEALSRILIPYYPVAGRFRSNADSRRIEIDCNEEGVMFVEAETTSIVDDFGDFAPTIEYNKLIPRVDCSDEISSFPLLLLQLTYFKCGGVSLGIAMHHSFADGSSRIGFINTWAELVRGLNPAASPCMDRTLLRARDPPRPKFHHVDCQPSPTLLIPRPKSDNIITRSFRVTRDQINALKKNSKKDGKTTTDYTSFEILSGHIWRCVCQARVLPDTQEVKLYIPVDARSRLEPNLPPSYLGNGIFMATPMATAGDLVSMPASYAADKIHEFVVKMDDEYLRSALDYIELHLDNVALLRGPHPYECPNLVITSWAKMRIYDADFGWGRTTFMGPGWGCKDICYLVPWATNDGVSVVITLEDQDLQLFETYFYRI